MPPRDTRLKLTKEQLFEGYCKICQYPDNPKTTCSALREGRGVCRKCIEIGLTICKKSSLENETNFQMR